VIRDDDEVEFVPNDVMLQIFVFAGHKDLVKRIGAVCRGWNFIATKSNKIWRELYESFFVRNKNSIVFEDESGDNTGTFDGVWRRNFVYRFQLRNRWRNNKPHSVECIDVLQEELVKKRESRRRGDHMFSKDQFLVGQSDSEDTVKKNLYSVDVLTRTTISALALDNYHLISGDITGKIKVFSLHSKQLVKQMNGHTASILTLTVESEKRRLYSVSSDCQVLIWDLDTSLCNGMMKIRTTSQTHEVYVVDLQIDTINRNLYIATSICIEVYDLDTCEFKFFLHPYVKKQNLANRRNIRNGEDQEMDEGFRRVEDHDDTIMENFHNAFDAINIPPPRDNRQQQQDEDDGEEIEQRNYITHMCINATVEYPRVAVCLSNGDVKIWHIFNKFGLNIKNIKLNNVISHYGGQTLGGFVITAPATDNSIRPVVQSIRFEDNRPNQILFVLRHEPVQVDYSRNRNTFLQIVDIGTGSEIIRKRVKLASVAINHYYTNQSFIYYDDDKIVRVSETEVIVYDRENGLKCCNITLPTFVFHFSITRILCDEKCLVLGTNFGGIIYIDFGGNLTYWRNMSGGQQLGKNN
jgi:WD40 repeat protein